MTRADILRSSVRAAIRVCSKCSAEKSPDEFHKGGRAVDGLHYWCKDCYNAWRAGRRLATRPPAAKPRRPRYKMQIGDRVGRWTVVGFAPQRGSKYYYSCRCDCGTEREVQSSNLRQGGTRSCGCYTVERLKRLYTKPNNAAAIHRIYTAYKDGAQKRGYEWALTKEDVDRLVRLPCHYCGTENSNRYTIRGPLFRHNGIDRADNTRGYTPGNVVPCCGPCNRSKHTMSSDEFIALAILITKKHGGGDGPR